MEDYDEFVQHRLSQLRKSEDSQPSSPAPSRSNGSSLIRFYGQPILPPLLSGKQREEMQRHRDAGQKATVQRNAKADARAAYVQTILHSVQLRKTQTLEEFVQESGLNTSKSSYSHNTSSGSVSPSDYVIGTKDSLSFSPPSDLHDGKDGVRVPPLTSTTYSAFSTYRATPQQRYQEECLMDQSEEKLESQPKTDPLNGISHQSLSSGYVTYENDENTTSGVEAGGESHGFGSFEGANNTGRFFLYNTSSTITKMPDIISHPPIEGEELEKSAVVSPFYNNFIAGDPLKDICSTSVAQVPSDGDEVRHLPKEKSESTHLESTEHEDSPAFTVIDDLGQYQNRDGDEGPGSSLGNSCFSGIPELSQTLATHHCSTTNQLQIQQWSRETEPADRELDDADLMPLEEPYRLSLQALLKKSQEYRRRQRMLRNQAKNSKIQERTQEQPREGEEEEEQSLSDKENDEFPYKATATAEGRKTREKSGTAFLSAETSPKKSWGNEERVSRREGVLVKQHHSEKAMFKSESTHLTGDGNTELLNRVEGKTASKNSQPDCPQEDITEPKQIGTCPQPQPVILTDNSLVQEAFYLTSEQSTTCLLSSFKEGGKYRTVPALQFCMSPIHCKNKGNIKTGEAIDRADAPKRTILVNTGLNVDQKGEPEGNLGHKNSQCPVVSPSVPLVGEGDATRVLAKSSAQAQQIDQLELNLSSLKVLISDLELTLTENIDNRSQTDSNLHSDVCHKGIEHSAQIKIDRHIGLQVGQNDCDYREDRPIDDDDRSDTDQDQRNSEWQRRQSLDNYKNKHEDTGPEPSINDPKDPPLIVQKGGPEPVNGREVRLVKTSTTENGKDKGTGKGGQTGVAPCRIQWSDRAPLTKDLSIMSYGQHEGCRKQQPPAKCITSLAQRMRIPDVFRKVPSETTVPRKGSVLSDTSNQPKERRNELAVEGEDSSHVLSLNQSYDVDTPSGLWLLEGSGSDLGSKGHHVQEKHLTPESGGEGQGGISKAKRRLLMHVTEGNEEWSGATSGGASWVVRPNSSTPKASVRCHEGHSGQKDKQQQLKQAHAAQVKALQDEHRRQQQELLQALAERYHLLQSVSFPCPMSSSRLGDTLTSPTVSEFSPPPPLPQPSSSVPECYRPLVLAAAKGFLTRRLFRTERVAQLLRTIRDTQQFLQAFQQQTPGRGEFCSRQDLLLQERVTLQLRSARYEVYDIFFSLSAGERMQLISWDRELARERELRRQSGHTGDSRGKSSLSAATQKSLERKRGMMIQKKAAERHRGVLTRAGHRTGCTAEQPPETKRRQIRANPQRVPKKTHSCRPR
ncbi:uncharacterized protein cp110 [Centroberyx affinis]|uniref:uncharacterized protein cp110 n=1 Tax=Centroberyx affinis TaxID=166261 RepID=UPI003A5C53A4